MKKKKVFILLFCLIFNLSIVFSDSIDNVIPKTSQANHNVYDEYQILSGEDIDYINNTNNDLVNKTKGQIVVAVVDSLGGYTVEEYATRMFQTWQIGDKQEKNGVLLLVAINDGKIKIETGYGSEGFIPDIIASRIIRNMVEYFPEGDREAKDKISYRNGIMEGYNEILHYFSQEYGVEIENQIAPNESLEEEGFSVAQIFLLMIVIIIIINTFNKKPPKGGKRRYYYGGFGGGPFGPYGGPSNRGSFGGSGRSSGGGGFSGRGGSSGGGGASGSW